jgi:hypothetical protein
VLNAHGAILAESENGSGVSSSHGYVGIYL